MTISKAFGFCLSIMILITSSACGSYPNSPLVGKWRCSDHPVHGWSIDYRTDGAYIVEFSDGRKPWSGHYQYSDFKITYSPDNPSEVSKIYLMGVVHIIDRTKRTAVFSEFGSGGTTCSLVT